MAQEGFLYEENVAKALKKKKWVKSNYTPAGASSNRPDLDLFIDNKEYGCELKKDLASAGSLVIHHIGKGKYEFGDTEGSPEKEFMKGLGMKAGILRKLSSTWGELFLHKTRDEKWKAMVRRYGYSLKERYEWDRDNATDIYFPLPKNTISSYYNIKYTYYINVGSHGFFLLGNKDPAGLNKYADPIIPLWDNNHTAILRTRVQSKGVTKASKEEDNKGWPNAGAQGYQVTMEISFKSVSTSPYNIGPVVGKSAVIDEKKIILPS